MSQIPPETIAVDAVSPQHDSPQTDSPQHDSPHHDSPQHELDSPPWLRVESTIMATAEAIRAAYDESMAPLGLTLSTASLLCYLADFGPVPQTRAAAHLNQGRASTGAQVDRLEEMGLAQRRPDPDDRRVWMVAVTDNGRKVAAQVVATDEVLRSTLRSGITRQERHQLASLLVRLQTNLNNTRSSAQEHLDQHGPQTTLDASKSAQPAGATS